MSDLSPQPALEGAAKRRSQRVLLSMPVDVVWDTGAGVRVREQGQTEVVSRHGALLKMETTLPASTQVDILRPSIGSAARARVVLATERGRDGMVRIAVELANPRADFWSIGLPLGN